MGKDEDFIMDEFEWALQDPTEKRLRELGEVVSIITGKLIDAFGKIEGRMDEVESSISSLESQISSLSSRVASGVAASPSAAVDASPAMASEPMAQAPKPKPAGAGAGGGMSMMGELKQLLAARRAKSDGPSDSSD
ncbi:MAG: hypothetical protein KAR33_05385 [Candidatus Thorarchaeota archaeon]|nr:hypothetical protein [Candidatus Thorarchaeota archaeon]